MDEIEELKEQFRKAHKFEHFSFQSSNFNCKYAVKVIKGSCMDYDFCLKRQIYLSTPMQALTEMVPYTKGEFLGFQTIETETGWLWWKTRERRDIPVFRQIHPCESCPYR
jgi:hypothetical protein